MSLIEKSEKERTICQENIRTFKLYNKADFDEWFQF